MIIVQVESSAGIKADPKEIPDILSRLEQHLAENNPSAIQELGKYTNGKGIREVAHSIKDALKDAKILPLSVHMSNSIVTSQIGLLMNTLVEVACPANDPLLADPCDTEMVEAWPGHRNYAVYVGHETGVPLVAAQAQAIRRYLVEHSDLDPTMVLLQGECHTVPDSLDCMVLIETPGIFHQPRCLANVFLANSNAVPRSCLWCLNLPCRNTQSCYTTSQQPRTN